MADISKIKMPDNVSYDLKDATAREAAASKVADVKVNGTSVVSNGAANIPKASDGTLGVIKINSSMGIGIYNMPQYPTIDGCLYINAATPSDIKEAASAVKMISAFNTDAAVFYGLSKVAGVNLKNETVTLGTYPDTSKAAIQNMLGVTSLFALSETSTAAAAHAANSLFIMGGKLMRATSAIAIGDAVEVGTNCEVVRADEVFIKNTDYATVDTPGVVKVGNYGIGIVTSGANAGKLYMDPASLNTIKNGTDLYHPLSPGTQHASVYYGLSKAAGVDLASETVTLGTYPTTSQAAIRTMLGAQAAVEVVRL